MNEPDEESLRREFSQNLLDALESLNEGVRVPPHLPSQVQTRGVRYETSSSEGGVRLSKKGRPKRY